MHSHSEWTLNYILALYLIHCCIPNEYNIREIAVPMSSCPCEKEKCSGYQPSENVAFIGRELGCHYS